MRENRYTDIIYKHYGEQADSFCGEQELADYIKFANVNKYKGFRLLKY